MFHASTYNYFATEFHRDLFIRVLFTTHRGSPFETQAALKKCIISGQPHNVLIEKLAPFRGLDKKRMVLFPHRVAPEKQVDIFRDLATHMPDTEFVVCQDRKLTKDEYHTLLGESMVIFSANLQETLGISAMEGVLVGSYPFLPNRLSYTEMYRDEFLYPSEWTESFAVYEANKDKVIGRLTSMLDNHSAHSPLIANQEQILREKYLRPGPMLDLLLS